MEETTEPVAEAANDYSEERVVQMVNETLELLAGRPQAVEMFNAVARAIDIEDAQWTNIWGLSEFTDGFMLPELYATSINIRQAVVRYPIIDRGAKLRYSYIWSKGINLPETAPKKGQTGPAKGIHQAITSPTAQAALFGADAWEANEKALYTDGNFFLVGDNDTKELHRIPLREITGLITNPEHNEEVWAWRRAWSIPALSTAILKNEALPKGAWYLTDQCPPKARKEILSSGTLDAVEVDSNKTIFVLSVNKQVGWPLGIPDAIAAVAWAKLYSEFLKTGYIMSRSLASIAFKASVSTKAAGDSASMKFASTQGAGQTAVLGAANSLTAVSTAGRGYDFDSGRAIASQVATAVQVSLIHLLSDPGAAGGSYGSAQTLDLPTQRAVAARQGTWGVFIERVLVWMGMKPSDARIAWPNATDADPYRAMQSLVLAWSTGAITGEELREGIIELLSLDGDPGDVPDGIMLPNNEKYFSPMAPEEPGISGGSVTTKPAAPGGAKKGASPTQGKASPAGKGPGANDVRSDTIAQAFIGMETNDLLREVLAKLDAQGR